MNDQAPLTLTLEEAAQLVVEYGARHLQQLAALRFSKDGWVICKWYDAHDRASPAGEGYHDIGVAWQDWTYPVSWYLDRPVVARDEAAELKAAIRKHLVAVDELRELQEADNAGQGGPWLLKTARAAAVVNNSLDHLRYLVEGGGHE